MKKCYFVVIDELAYWIQWESVQGILDDDPINCLFIDPMISSDFSELYEHKAISIATATSSLLDANDFILNWATKYSINDIEDRIDNTNDLTFDQKIEKLQLINLHCVLQKRFRSSLNFNFVSHKLGRLNSLWIDHKYRYLIYSQDI